MMKYAAQYFPPSSRLLSAKVIFFEENASNTFVADRYWPQMVLDPPGDFWPSWSHWAWWETVLFAIIGMPLWLTWCLIHLSLHFFGSEKKNSFQEGWWRWLFLCWCNSLVFISDDMLIQLGGVSRILFGRSQRLVSESFELTTRDKHLGFQIEELWAQNQRHVFYQTEGHFPRVGWLDFRDRMVGECWK